MLKGNRSLLLRYGAAVGAAIFAHLLTRWLWMQPSASPLFLAAVAFSAWYGGLGPGLLATALATSASAYAFLQPDYVLDLGVDDFLRLSVFGSVACLISSLSGKLSVAKQRAERSLLEVQASEEKYRRIVDTAYEGIWTINAAACTEYVNQRAAEMFGYTVEEMLGRSIFDFMDDAVHGEAVQNLERLKQGIKEQFDCRYRRKDGSELWALVSTNAILNEQGDFIGAIALLTDITQRKQAEAELAMVKDKLAAQLVDMTRLHEMSLRLSTQLELNPVLEEVLTAVTTLQKTDMGVLMLYDREQNDLYPVASVGFTDEYFNLIGRLAPGVGPCGRAIAQRHRVIVEDIEADPLFAPFLPAAKLADYRAVYSTPLLTRSGDIVGTITTSFCDRHYPSDREIRMVELYARQAAELIDNARLYREAQEAVQRKDESLALLNTLLSTAPVGLAFIDRDFRFVHINDSLAALNGIPRQAHVGRSVREVLPKLAPKVEPLWQSILDTGEPIVDLLLSGEPIGTSEYKYCLASYYAVRSANGSILGIGAVVTDITERKRAEVEREQLLAREQAARIEAEAASRAKDEFLAVLSHELRTPLNSMLGWARLLRSRKLDEATTARALETIERNAKSQTQLIEDILDVSRIIRGKVRLYVRPVQLKSAVEAAIDSVRLAAEAKAIQIRSVFDPLTTSVLGDPDRLQQVVWNLLSNAIKFTPKGGQVEVRLERVHSQVEIQVQDTGPGISPEFLPYVFDRFRQADSTSTRVHGGLGLGLAIVRHLVELHGGTVQVNSPGVGQGATFTVSLPLMAVYQNIGDLNCTPAAVNGSEICCETPPTLDGLQVLVVDDEADARELLSTVLKECGAEVKAVASAGEAIAAIEQLQPDVLLSDIGMPGEDGYALIRRVRAIAAQQGKQIPAAALTAYAREEDQKQALLAGFQLHVPKPVNPAELAAVVASLAKQNGKVD